LKWVIAFPAGFILQVISSGLDVPAQQPDLTGFGEYSRILKTHPQVALLKNLLPPTPVKVRLRYAQEIAR
jgi:hypothetical protein